MAGNTPSLPACSGNYLAQLWHHNTDYDSDSGFGLQIRDVRRRKWLPEIKAASAETSDDPQVTLTSFPLFQGCNTAAEQLLLRTQS